jgi:hypothetical protein
VRLVEGVDKVLNLGHGEFTDAEQARLGRDFVTERLANLRGAKGQFEVVELVQPLEGKEDALSCFRPEKAVYGRGEERR